jgi:DNA-binding transcriptional regulator LsrR (DeoR family)|tara:strand:- start:324 stop:527 length:204 start_codon:yes stop_codon:yes gene_type:complete
LYSFTGLRGDAKELYRSIAQRKEKRAQLVQAKTVHDQAAHLQDADLIIWACGYASNFLPIYDFGLNG